MKTLLQGDKRVKEILGKQIREKENYRLGIYSIAVENGDEFLVFNQITKELIVLDKDEYNNIVNSEYAIENWFAFPENFHEQELVKKLRKELQTRSIIPNEVYLYHIFTTTSCNARCYYCFEKGNQNCGYMNEEVAKKLADYIVKHNPKDERVMLAWFGGEPLLNTKVIDTVCERLNRIGFEYDSIMATNAYLIDDTIVEKAKNSWNMIAWNITIDGTEQVYNKTKDFVYNDPSPYKKIIKNIASILEAGMKVNIRLNLGIHNSEDLSDLVDELYETFGQRDNFCVYCATLYERQTDTLFKRNDREEVIIRTKEKELYDKIVRLGLFDPRLSREFQVYRCNPDMGWAVSVLPDGRIGWCEDYVDKKIISHIDDTKFETKIINWFKERFEDLPECASCPLYTDCIRLKACNIDTPWCTEGKRDVRLHKLKTSMINEYAHFMKNNK